MKKEIPGYEGLYIATSDGNIYSIRTKRILKSSICRAGYKQVVLYKDNSKKCWRIHKLIAITFLPNPDCLPIINHKDENILNNNVENLEWCTYEYNCRHSGGYEKTAEGTRKWIENNRDLFLQKSSKGGKNQTGKKKNRTVCDKCGISISFNRLDYHKKFKHI